MKGKRTISVAMAAIVVSGLLSSCGQSQEEKTGDEKEQVTLQYWYQGTDQLSTEFAQRCVESFNEKYPDIKVEATGMSTTISDQETKLNAATLSDTYPDVIAVVLAEVGSRGSLGDFEPLEPYIEKWKEKEDLFDSAYEMGKYQGTQVALGVLPNPQIYTYRKDVFKEAGLDPEDPPSTWAELKDTAEKLTKREGDKVVFAGLDIPSIDSSLVFTEPYMRTAGSKVVDEGKGEPAFTDEAAVEALNFLGEMAQMNIFIPHDQQKGEEHPFVNGNAAISNLSTANIQAFRANYPDAELGYLPILKKDENSGDGVCFCGYQLIAMSGSSKHKDEAWLFMEHMMSNDVVWDRTETFNTPIVKKSLEDKYMESGDKELKSAILNYVENGKGKATVPWVSELNKYVSVAYEEVINGKKTAQEALNDANDLLTKEISK